MNKIPVDDINLDNVSVVLHRPVYPRNVGMSARAAANLGVNRLIVIDPRFDWNLGSNQFEARQGAAHASPLIRSTKVYSDLRSFCDSVGSGVRFALSGIESPARRTEQLEVVLNRLSADPDHSVWHPKTAIQLHFGTEDSGLSREEFELMNFVCMLPTSSSVPSLNISHAVLLATFILKQALLSQSHLEHKVQPQVPIPSGRLEHPRKAIRNWLLALGFDLDSRRNSIEVSLNRVLLSHCPHPEDVRLVEKVLFQTVAKLAAKSQSDENQKTDSSNR